MGIISGAVTQRLQIPYYPIWFDVFLRALYVSFNIFVISMIGVYRSIFDQMCVKPVVFLAVQLVKCMYCHANLHIVQFSQVVSAAWLHYTIDDAEKYLDHCT